MSSNGFVGNETLYIAYALVALECEDVPLGATDQGKMTLGHGPPLPSPGPRGSWQHPALPSSKHKLVNAGDSNGALAAKKGLRRLSGAVDTYRCIRWAHSPARTSHPAAALLVWSAHGVCTGT